MLFSEVLQGLSFYINWITVVAQETIIVLHVYTFYTVDKQIFHGKTARTYHILEPIP